MTPARPSLASRAAPLSRARARRYAHRLSTVLLARGQDAHLFEYEKDASGALRRTERPNARDGRGWPYYEQDRAPAPRAPLPSRRAPPLARQAMSALFKLAPPGPPFKVPGCEGEVEGWRKAIRLAARAAAGTGGARRWPRPASPLPRRPLPRRGEARRVLARAGAGAPPSGAHMPFLSA